MIWEKFQEKRMLGSAKTKLTSPFFDHLSESRKPLFRSGIECSLSETCCWALPPPAAHHHPPQLRLTSAQWHRLLSSFFRSVILSHMSVAPKLSLPKISSKLSVDTSKKNNPLFIFRETCLFSCPVQLNRWPCHSLINKVSESLLILALQWLQWL